MSDDANPTAELLDDLTERRPAMLAKVPKPAVIAPRMIPATREPRPVPWLVPNRRYGRLTIPDELQPEIHERHTRGETQEQIAEGMGVSVYAIRRLFRRNARGPRKLGSPRRLDYALVRECRARGENLKQIAERFGVSVSGISRALKREADETSRLEPAKKKLTFGRALTVTRSGDGVVIGNGANEVRVQHERSDIVRRGIVAARDRTLIGRREVGIVTDIEGREITVFVDSTSSGNFLCFGIVEGNEATGLIRLDADDVEKLARVLGEIKEAGHE